MIPLTRGERPHQLTDQVAKDLTSAFLADGSAVWNAEFIRERLLQSSDSKCAYCETKIDEESKYMEVDHYRCKKDFPLLVVSWENLVPACKRCNVRKSSYNVEVEGAIIDPFMDVPSRHIYLKNYRLRWRDDKGRSTIDTLYLNQTDRLVQVRLMVGEGVSQALEKIRDKLEEYLGGEKTTRKRNAITRGVEILLLEAGPGAEYSATAATVLLEDPNYDWIKSALVSNGLWHGLEQLEVAARRYSLSF